MASREFRPLDGTLTHGLVTIPGFMYISTNVSGTFNVPLPVAISSSMTGLSASRLNTGSFQLAMQDSYNALVGCSINYFCEAPNTGLFAHVGAVSTGSTDRTHLSGSPLQTVEVRLVNSGGVNTDPTRDCGVFYNLMFKNSTVTP